MGKEQATVRGFVRGALTDVETGETRMGEWHENAITQVGYEQWIIGNITHLTQTQYPVWMGISSCSDNFTPSSTSTALASEFANGSTTRTAITPSVIASKTLQMVASWASSDCTGTIGGIGVFAVSSTNSGTAGSLASFPYSVKASNQTFAVTYQWRFS